MPIDVTVKLVGSKEFEEGIERLKNRALPYIAKDLLNGAAHALDIYWRAGIATSFTHRDKSGYLERSTRIERARGSDIGAMTAKVGVLASRAPLMGEMEEGGEVHGKTGHQPIPAPTAAAQAPGTTRTRRVIGSRALRAISVQKPVSGKGRKQQNAIALAQAKRKGQKFALLVRPSGGKGLFMVMGRKGHLTGRLVYDLSKGSVRVPGSHVLQHAIDQTMRVMPAIADAAIQSQLRMQNIGK